jgi:hypothetical protein
MQRETPYFVCPFIRTKFHGKSYTAYKLRKGFNYAQFLGLTSLSSTQRSLVLPSDVTIDERIIIQLPHMTELPKRANLPIRVYTPPSVEEHDAGHDEVLEASVSDVTADALYEVERSLDDTGQGLATPITPVEPSGVRDTQRSPNPDNRPGVNDNTLHVPQPGHKRGNPEPSSNAANNKRTKSIPDEVELTRMMNDAGAVTPDATIHGTASAAVQAIRKALYGDSPSYPDTNADPSPDSEYGSEIDAPLECDLKPNDDNMFCSIELMDNDLWDQAEEDKSSRYLEI